MLTPPFKLAARPDRAAVVASPDDASVVDEAVVASRRRLVDLDGHLHCSVIGTCLSTTELRRLMERHAALYDAEDVEVHHEAVRLISERGVVAKALQKALDRKHEAAIRAVSRLHGDAAIAAYWSDALLKGEVPGAYWAVLMHRDTGSERVRRIFGDVHMLSHLVGASNRADIRQLVALKKQNDWLTEMVDALKHELHDAKDERTRLSARVRDLLSATRLASVPKPLEASGVEALTEALTEAVRLARADASLQQERSARWEEAATAAAADADGLREERAELLAKVAALEGELGAVEGRFEQSAASASDPRLSAFERVQGRRILYVGGRPGSTTAIRDLVTRHGGTFRSHDGGLEDRKGLLAPAVASSDVVVFPVDCIDHDSAGNLKRLCTRNRVPFIPLRSAGVASFVAGLAQSFAPTVG